MFWRPMSICPICPFVPRCRAPILIMAMGMIDLATPIIVINLATPIIFYVAI